jgi:DNA helicase-2/ATP-dependent DNA helicase PcrA
VHPWPVDPAGGARAVLDRAAAAVRAAQGTARGSSGPDLHGAFAALGSEVERLLAERDLLRRTHHEVVLPSHLSASRAVRLARDPGELALALRRPVPVEPSRRTRLGTSFHEWVEQQLRSQALLDLDDLEGAGDDRDGPPPELAALQESFLGSEWAGREVVDVEVDVETSVAGTVLRGRVDAVFRAPRGSDGSPRYDVVDWKTGPVPRGADLDAARVQLAVYRLAWARLRGLAVEQVGAAFFHVGVGVTVRLADAVGEAELARLLGGVPVAGQAS